MAKIVYNACYGGFGLSAKAAARFKELTGEQWAMSNVPRHHPALVQLVEELGDIANGHCAKLVIEEVPSGTPYRIEEYDGYETLDTIDSIIWTIAP